MQPIGLDIGTGFVKASCAGKRVSFPSLFACRYSDGTSIDDLDCKRRNALESAVGRGALSLGAGRDSVLIRPVKHGVPNHDAGFAALIREAIRRLDMSGAEVAIGVGVTYDARDSIQRIGRLVRSATRAKDCLVLPQAYGTLVSCGMRSGTVINIGHGTTEIISISGSSHEGISIPKAGSFVTDQLDKRRGSYVDHKRIFAENEQQTSRLVMLLAEHISDETSRIAHSGGIVLAGGGSLLPGMREAMEASLGTKLTVPDDPIFSNAVGLEIICAQRTKTGRDAVRQNQPRPADKT